MRIGPIGSNLKQFFQVQVPPKYSMMHQKHTSHVHITLTIHIHLSLPRCSFKYIKPHLSVSSNRESLTKERPLITSRHSPADFVRRLLSSSPRASWRLFRLAGRQKCPSQHCIPRHNFYGLHVELPNVLWSSDPSTVLERGWRWAVFRCCSLCRNYHQSRLRNNNNETPKREVQSCIYTEEDFIFWQPYLSQLFNSY